MCWVWQLSCASQRVVRHYLYNHKNDQYEASIGYYARALPDDFRTDEVEIGTDGLGGYLGGVVE